MHCKYIEITQIKNHINTSTKNHINDEWKILSAGPNNGDGRIGRTGDSSIPLPIQNLSPQNDIKCLSAGGYHSAVLLKDGSVLEWGWFNRKFLIKSYEDQNQLLKIALEESTIAVFGYHEPWIASESGTIYWVLNIDPLKYLLLLPLKDGPPKPIVSTLKTVLLIKSNGEALGMVKKIRQSDDIEKEHIVFTCVNIFSPIESLHGMKINKVSGNNRFFLVLTEDNKVFAWGENDRGQFGFTDTEDRFDRFVSLSVYKDTTIVDIAAGDSHSILIDSSGHLWRLGYNY